MLVGLDRPDSGTMSLFGLPVPNGLPRTIGRIGAVVEQPRLFPGMSGRDNLRLLCIAGGIDERRVGEVLDLVGLRERAADRVKGYSLGMKQRLALAATLLRDPDLLILDEPTNGLDPAGIREIRELMRSLADQGVTILVSSHILSELQQVVDHVTIINRGRLLASGPVDQILGESRGGVRLTVAEPDRATTVLTAEGLVVVRDHESLRVTGAAEPAQITRLLADQGLYVSSLRPSSNDLESAFLEITGEDATAEETSPSEGTPPPAAGGTTS